MLSPILTSTSLISTSRQPPSPIRPASTAITTSSDPVVPAAEEPPDLLPAPSPLAAEPAPKTPLTISSCSKLDSHGLQQIKTAKIFIWRDGQYQIRRYDRYGLMRLKWAGEPTRKKEFSRHVMVLQRQLNRIVVQTMLNEPFARLDHGLSTKLPVISLVPGGQTSLVSLNIALADARLTVVDAFRQINRTMWDRLKGKFSCLVGQWRELRRAKTMKPKTYARTVQQAMQSFLGSLAISKSNQEKIAHFIKSRFAVYQLATNPETIRLLSEGLRTTLVAPVAPDNPFMFCGPKFDKRKSDQEAVYRYLFGELPGQPRPIHALDQLLASPILSEEELRPLRDLLKNADITVDLLRPLMTGLQSRESIARQQKERLRHSQMIERQALSGNIHQFLNENLYTGPFFYRQNGIRNSEGRSYYTALSTMRIADLKEIADRLVSDEDLSASSLESICKTVAEHMQAIQKENLQYSWYSWRFLSTFAPQMSLIDRTKEMQYSEYRSIKMNQKIAEIAPQMKQVIENAKKTLFWGRTVLKGKTQDTLVQSAQHKANAVRFNDSAGQFAHPWYFWFKKIWVRN